LVLQSRVRDFQPEMLQELLYTDRKLIDGWDKMMSIYSVEDWPYFRRYREAARQKLGAASRPAASILDQVRQDIADRGPVSSIDLDYDETVNWSWAPTRLARAALESMYFWGELIIDHKVNTRKVYDFASRHLPAGLLDAPDPNASRAEFYDWYLLRRIGGIGLLWNKAGDAWLGINELNSKERNASIQRLLEREALIEVTVAGIKVPFYLRTQDQSQLNEVLDTKPPAPRFAFLAPLDNLLWERRMIHELFEFDYRWEVYKPAPERKYGYYVLPVLYGDRFVARFEPGRDKKNGALIIKDWWWEPGVRPTKKMGADLQICFQQFRRFLKADRLEIAESTAIKAGLEMLRQTE